VSEASQILWRQLGAAIDMLENAMRACPDELWNGGARQPEFWYVAYHTLFFLDLYLSDTIEGFTPPAPFSLSELDPDGAMPERVYTKSELGTYLQHTRNKYRSVLEGLTEEQGARVYKTPWLELSFAELLLYTLRHVQHHAGQLNLMLRQETGSAPRWVKQVRE
jgi:DinB superfamily